MEQGLPLCSSPRSGRATPCQALCPRGSGCGRQGWTSPDVDSSATPVPGLRGHRPNTPCGLVPSQAPTPRLTGPQLPCCIRLLSSCTHTPSLLHNCSARAWHPQPGWPRRPRGNHSPAGRAGTLCSRLGRGGEDAWPGARVLQALPRAPCETPTGHVPSQSLFPPLSRKISFQPGDPDSHSPSSEHHQHPPLPWERPRERRPKLQRVDGEGWMG